MLDHAVGARGAKRLCEKRDAALVDRSRAHLHGGGDAGLGSHDDALDPVEREGRDGVRERAGEVDPRRAGIDGRRAGDRAVDRVDPGRGEERRDLARGARRDGVEVGDDRSCSSGGLGNRRRSSHGGLRRDHGEDDVRLAEERPECAEVLEAGLGC